MAQAAMHYAARQELRRRQLFRLEIDHAVVDALGDVTLGLAAVRGLNNLALWGPEPWGLGGFPRLDRLTRVRRACLMAGAATECIIDAWDINRLPSSVCLTVSSTGDDALVGCDEPRFVTRHGQQVWCQRNASSAGAGRITRLTSNVAVVCRDADNVRADAGCGQAVSLIKQWCGGHATRRQVSVASLSAGTFAV